MDMKAMTSKGYLLSSDDDETDDETVAYDDYNHCSIDEEKNYESDE